MANVFVQRSNRLGVPLLLALSFDSDGTNTTFHFNNHVNIPDEFTGLLLVKLPAIVATDTEPVYFDTINVPGSAVPLYLNTGAAATVAAITSTAAPTYHLCVYDSTANRLQLIA